MTVGPLFNQVAIKKDSIADVDSFVNLIKLFDLKIAYEEKDYYIIDGTHRNLKLLLDFWQD